MNSIINSIYTSACSMFVSFYRKDSPKDLMIEMPPFDAKEWKNLGLKKVETSEMPKKMQIFLDSPCLVWSGKSVKETHFVFLVPANLTISQLYELAGPYALYPLLKDFSKTTHKAYWVAITKRPLPDTRYISFAKQKERLEKNGYQIPNLFEAASAVVCAKAFRVSLFPEAGFFTRCKECLDQWPLALGSDSGVPFAISTNDANELNGVAGVKRFEIEL